MIVCMYHFYDGCSSSDPNKIHKIRLPFFVLQYCIYVIVFVMMCRSSSRMSSVSFRSFQKRPFTRCCVLFPTLQLLLPQQQQQPHIVIIGSTSLLMMLLFQQKQLGLRFVSSLTTKTKATTTRRSWCFLQTSSSSSSKSSCRCYGDHMFRKIPGLFMYNHNQLQQRQQQQQYPTIMSHYHRKKTTITTITPSYNLHLDSSKLHATSRSSSSSNNNNKNKNHKNKNDNPTTPEIITTTTQDMIETTNGGTKKDVTNSDHDDDSKILTTTATTTTAPPNQTNKKLVVAPGLHTSWIELEIKKSRFIAYVSAVPDWDRANEILTKIKCVDHPKARHWCYGYIGSIDDGSSTTTSTERSSDDGEPSGTGGVPILNALRYEQITDVLCIVVRYYGGIQLGTGGLIRAYGLCARELIQRVPKIQYLPQTIIYVTIQPMHIGYIYDLVTSFNKRMNDEACTVVQEMYHTDGTLSMTLSIHTDKVEEFQKNIMNVSKGSAIISSSTTTTT